jgi:hypothetical protein
MILSPEESEAVNFLAARVLAEARQLPCKDAAKLLHGFLVIAGNEYFPEVRALYSTLHHCDAQLQLLTEKPLISPATSLN